MLLEPEQGGGIVHEDVGVEHEQALLAVLAERGAVRADRCAPRVAPGRCERAVVRGGTRWREALGLRGSHR